MKLSWVVVVMGIHEPSVIHEQHRQSSEAAADHPRAWSVVSNWRCGALVVFTTPSLVSHCKVPRAFVWQDVQQSWLVQKWFTCDVVADWFFWLQHHSLQKNVILNPVCNHPAPDSWCLCAEGEACMMEDSCLEARHTHTHTTILRPFSGTTSVSRCQKRTSGHSAREN